MTIKIGINGFGRIGRMVFRAAVQNFPDIEVVAINDLLEPDYLAYMLQYDSVHGRFKGEIGVDGNTLVVNGKRIRLTQEKDPANLKWGDVGAGIVIESTGLFLTKEAGQKHASGRVQVEPGVRSFHHPQKRPAEELHLPAATELDVVTRRRLRDQVAVLDVRQRRSDRRECRGSR